MNERKSNKPQMRFDTSFVDFADQIFGKFTWLYPAIATSKHKAEIEYTAMWELREEYDMDVSPKSNKWSPDKTLDYAIYVLQWLNMLVDRSYKNMYPDDNTVINLNFTSDNIFKFNAVWKGIKAFIADNVEGDRVNVLREGEYIEDALTNTKEIQWYKKHNMVREISKESLTKLMVEFSNVVRILELVYKRYHEEDLLLNKIIDNDTGDWSDFYDGLLKSTARDFAAVKSVDDVVAAWTLAKKMFFKPTVADINAVIREQRMQSEYGKQHYGKITKFDIRHKPNLVTFDMLDID
jgi:hypothetical protein